MVKTSFIWEMPLEVFKDIVKNNKSYSGVLRALGRNSRNGGNFRTLKERIKQEKIDVSHFQHVGENNFKRKKGLDEILVNGSNYNRGHLKRRLLKEGLIKNKCAVCGLGPEWNNKKLVMVLDHINGINNDNRIENLRLICPNCNSQQSTFAGGNQKKKTKVYLCPECNILRKKSKAGKTCDVCRKLKIRKVDRPNLDQLQKDIKSLGYEGTGRKYGVSGNSIRKWIR